jgi:hypothetical protein
MKLFKRILYWSLGGITAVIILAAGAGYTLLRSSLPVTEGRQAVPKIAPPPPVATGVGGLRLPPAKP